MQQDIVEGIRDVREEFLQIDDPVPGEQRKIRRGERLCHRIPHSRVCQDLPWMIIPPGGEIDEDIAEFK